jgi:predicted nucleic acid-binding protein
MNRAVYDTRFFIELYYSKDEALLRKIVGEKARKEKYVSAVAIHEVYKLTLAAKGEKPRD